MDRTGLCQPCQDALLRSIDIARTNTAGVHVGAHKTVESLVTASDLGCVICSALWRPLSPAQRAAVAVHEDLRGSITDLLVEAIEAQRPELVGSWDLWARIESEALSEFMTDEERSCMFLLIPAARRSKHLNTVHLAERKQRSQNITTQLLGRHRLVQQRLGKQH